VSGDNSADGQVDPGVLRNISIINSNLHKGEMCTHRRLVPDPQSSNSVGPPERKKFRRDSGAMYLRGLIGGIQ
jgi:hypothetical protein